MRIKVAGLLILISIISGCSSGNNNSTDVKLQTGTKGLTLEFLQGFPEQVGEEENFFAGVEIRNEGFSDIKNGKLIATLEQDFLNIMSWELPSTAHSTYDNVISYDLKGKTISNTRGDRQIIRAVINAKKIDDTRNKMRSNVVFTACYPYSTVLSDVICIDTDPNNLGVAEKSCEAKEVTGESQGAPIAITKIEYRIIPGGNSDEVGMEFGIYAQNKGDGLLINRERYEDICLGHGIEKEDYNVVTLKRLSF